MAEVRVLRPRKFVRSYVERTNLEALDVPTPQRVSSVISHVAHSNGRSAGSEPEKVRTLVRSPFRAVLVRLGRGRSEVCTLVC